MKLNKLSILIGLILLFWCCGEQRTDLPPRYGMLCNVDSSKFIATMPGGTRLYKWDYGSVAYNNLEDAVKRAWSQYNHVSLPPDTTNWIECTKCKE